MTSSIMANTTQDEEKNAVECNATGQEVKTPEQNGESSEALEGSHSNEAENEVDHSVTMNEVGETVETTVQTQIENHGETQVVSKDETETLKEDKNSNEAPAEVDTVKEPQKESEVVTESSAGSEVVTKVQEETHVVNDVESESPVKSEENGIVSCEDGDCEVQQNNVDGNADNEVNKKIDGESDHDMDGDLEEYEDAVDDEGDEGENGGDGDGEGEGEDFDVEGEELPEEKVEKQLDHDQDRRNPQYIPKGGAFYEHDNRTSSEDIKTKDAQDVEKKKKVWKESKKSERWSHDCYNEYEQQPKTKAEIMETYGYDIRNEEAPPRARRRRKYGRGPDKYDRNWEDEQAYMAKPNLTGRRGKKKSFGRDEFPPLPNQKGEENAEKNPPKSQGWKKEEESVKRTIKVNNHEKSSRNSQINRNEYSTNRGGSGGGDSGGGGGGGIDGHQTVNSNKKIFPQSKKIIKDDIKPFRQYDKTKWKGNNFRRGKPEEIFKPNKSKPASQGESQTPRSIESNKSYSGDSDVGHVTEGFSQMTFHSKHSNLRENLQDSNEIGEQEMDSPARLNPKRYSRNRKTFTGFFPPDEIAEINPAEVKQLQQEQQQKSQQHVSLQHQPLNIQSVIRRYPGTYNGNPGYIAPRPIIASIPQQGMSPQSLQQALSPQGIPQQALSPQVPGLQTIDLQQGPIPPQPNFVPPMYIDMDPHYAPSDMMGPYTGYAPFSANQPGEMYQQSGGITYYNTECQNSNQIRAPPARRQKTVIPILAPPK